MTRAARATPLRPVHPSYAALTAKLALRPFRSEGEYDAATAVLQRLVIRDARMLDEGERDYLETLELLIEAYEDEHYPSEREDDPVGALRFLMEQNGVTITDLGRLLGSKSTASEILSGKTLISRANAFKLGERFSVHPALFLQPPRKQGSQLQVQSRKRGAKSF